MMAATDAIGWDWLRQAPRSPGTSDLVDKRALTLRSNAVVDGGAHCGSREDQGIRENRGGSTGRPLVASNQLENLAVLKRPIGVMVRDRSLPPQKLTNCYRRSPATNDEGACDAAAALSSIRTLASRAQVPDSRVAILLSAPLPPRSAARAPRRTAAPGRGRGSRRTPSALYWTHRGYIIAIGDQEWR
jgi:hypothetical protein